MDLQLISPNLDLEHRRLDLGRHDDRIETDSLVSKDCLESNEICLPFRAPKVCI